MRARWLAPALLLATVGGCAWFVPNFKTPRLTVVDVHVRRANFWQQKLEVRLRVHNPNGIGLPIEAIHYTLQIENQTFANGDTVARFTVPAHGSAEFDTEVTANMAGALVTILGHGGRRFVHYQLRGKVELAHGLLRDLPFDERGRFRLK